MEKGGRYLLPITNSVGAHEAREHFPGAVDIIILASYLVGGLPNERLPCLFKRNFFAGSRPPSSNEMRGIRQILRDGSICSWMVRNKRTISHSDDQISIR
jgi:hypothetical protein